MTKQKVVLFDAMGVIYTDGDDTVNLTYPFMKRYNPGLQLQTLVDGYAEACVARITPDQLWARCGITENIPSLEQDYLDTMLELDPDAPMVLERLSHSCRLGMLSNDIGRWSAHLRRHFDLDRYFEQSVISGDVKQRKPDPGIYLLAAQRMKAEPSDCVFVDDRPVNLAASAAVGMRPILYNRAGHVYAGEQIQRLSQLLDLL